MVSMLTTIDNPYDPFDQFDEWNAFDEELARINDRPTTCSYLAHITKTSNELSQADEELAIESAIDEIVRLNILGIYKKVSRPDESIDDTSDDTTK
jgi:acetyl-CoA carboxylase alpha subunit